MSLFHQGLSPGKHLPIRMRNFWFGMHFIVCIAFGVLFNSNAARGENGKIKIAAIIPDDNSRIFSIAKSAPAIQIAVEKVKATSLLPNHDLVVKYADSQCSAKWGPLAAFNFYRNRDVHVFLGPVCDYVLAPVARYAPEWNLPVISPGGFAHDFGNKDPTSKGESFPSLTRVHLAYASLGDVVVSTLQYYKWRVVKLIYISEGYSDIMIRFCYLAISAVVKRIRGEENLVYELYLIKPEDEKNNYETIMDEVGIDYSGKIMKVFPLNDTRQPKLSPTN